MPPRQKAASLDFTTKARDKTPLTFTLDGDTYTFTPPKEANTVLPILEGNITEVSATKLTFDWLGEGLAEGETEKIIARLKDPEDDLDIKDLVTIVKGLSEAIGERPTT